MLFAIYITGLAIGALMILSTIYVLVASRQLTWFTLCFAAFGVLLIGLGIFSNFSISAGADGLQVQINALIDNQKILANSLNSAVVGLANKVNAVVADTSAGATIPKCPADQLTAIEKKQNGIKTNITSLDGAIADTSAHRWIGLGIIGAKIENPNSTAKIAVLQTQRSMLQTQLTQLQLQADTCGPPN